MVPSASCNDRTTWTQSSAPLLQRGDLHRSSRSPWRGLPRPRWVYWRLPSVVRRPVGKASHKQVGNPQLFEPECHTPEQMRMANAFCRYLKLAQHVGADDPPVVAHGINASAASAGAG